MGGIEAKPLSGVLGAEMEGVDRSSLAPGEFEGIHEALLESGVVIGDRPR